MIVYMQEKDLDEVVLLEQQVFSKPWSRKSFADSVAKPENLYLVARDRDELLGFCGLWGVGDEGQITHVCVKESARGKGVGKQLLLAMLAQGKERGLQAFTLEVRVSNTPARELYKKVGFSEAGIRKGFYDAPKEDAMIMWL